MLDPREIGLNAGKVREAARLWTVELESTLARL
jgi:hypothetical protein